MVLNPRCFEGLRKQEAFSLGLEVERPKSVLDCLKSSDRPRMCLVLRSVAKEKLYGQVGRISKARSDSQ